MDNLGAIVAQPIESRCPGLRSLLVSGESIRRQPLFERKAALKWVLRKAREGIQYVEHAHLHCEMSASDSKRTCTHWVNQLVGCRSSRTLGHLTPYHPASRTRRKSLGQNVCRRPSKKAEKTAPR